MSTLHESSVPPFVTFMYFEIHRYFKSLLWPETIFSLTVSGVSGRVSDLAEAVSEVLAKEALLEWAQVSPSC